MVIGSLAVNIVANTEKFSRGISNARKQVTLMEKGVRSLKGALGAFGVAFSASFAISQIRRTISELDDLSDTAERLGTSAEKLSRLQYAGLMSDVSVDKLARSLTFMEKAVGNNAKAFQKLGLDVANLRGMDAVDMFVEISAAIQAMPTPAERTASAMAIFGRGAAELMELMGKGRAGIESLMAGTPFAVKESDIEQIKKADNAIKQLTATLEGFKRVVAMEVVEEVSGFADGLQKLDKMIRDLDRNAQKFVDDWGIFLGMIDRKDTRTFRRQRSAEIADAAEFLKGSKAREIASWPADMQAEYRALGQRPKEGLGMFDNFEIELGMKKFAGVVTDAAKSALDFGRAIAPRNIFKNQGMGGSPFGFAAFGMQLGLSQSVAMMRAAVQAPGGLGQRQGPLEALVGGTREASIASRENLRPRSGQAEDMRKTQMNTKQTAEHTRATRIAVEKIAAGGGTQIIGASIGG